MIEFRYPLILFFYAPALIIWFYWIINSRNKTKFEIKNTPYKPIIKDNIHNNIKSSKDLKIKTDNNNIDIKNKLNELSNKRDSEDLKSRLDLIIGNHNIIIT